MPIDKRSYPTTWQLVLVALIPLFPFVQACTHVRVPAASQALATKDFQGWQAIESMRRTVDAITAAATNRARGEATRKRVEEIGLLRMTRSEPIGWMRTHENIIIEIPGHTMELVYVVAHHDKADHHPGRILDAPTGGALDKVASRTYSSDDAIDNASGVAVALEIARALSRRKLKRTYRILLTASEETGLHGSVAHIDNLSYWEKGTIAQVVNIDSVGLATLPNCILSDVSDSELVHESKRIARDLKLPLGVGQLPKEYELDTYNFRHMRSDVAPKLAAFTACGVTGPVGRYIHGPRDRADRISPERLLEQYRIALELLLHMDATAEHLPGDLRLSQGE